MPLKDRNRFIPGGFRFIQPQIPQWSVRPWSSFDDCVDQIVAVRMANPLITRNNNLSTDRQTVANELDAYNAAICEQMGWVQFLSGAGDTTPKPTPLSQLSQSAARVVAGVETIREWSIDGVLVPQDLAEGRAKGCSVCPKNGSATLTDWFTKPAADLITVQLEKRNNLKIRTAYDPLLGTCEACACPLKLKVHTPLEIINAKMRPQDRAQLDVNCWILAESK